LKVSYVLPVYWPAIGGCELHTHELVGRLCRKHDVRVITQITRQADKPDDLWSGTLTRPLPPRPPYRDHRAPVTPLHFSSWERLLLLPFVRYHHRMQEVSMRVVRGAFRRKLLGHVRGSDLIHCIHNGASFYGYTALACARELGIPFVFTPLLQIQQAMSDAAAERGDDVERPPLTPGSLAAYLAPKRYHDRFWLKTAQQADGLISMTAFEKELLVAEGVRADRIHEIGMGPLVSEHYDGAAFRRARGIGDREMVLFLGRKNRTKGFEEVLRAAPRVWARRPGVCFVFVGPKEGDAAQVFRRYEDGRIIEIDAVDLDEKSSALHACDVLCMPSLYEALGGVFLEAWWFGKPVIAGDTPPLRELVGDRQGGLLVQLDPSEIADSIITLLDAPDLRERMGAWGRQKVASRYSWDAVAARVESVYRQLIERA